jgi:hypothetical protein
MKLNPTMKYFNDKVQTAITQGQKVELLLTRDGKHYITWSCF